MSVTQTDVAARAGVSRALVSLVMRNSPRVADATRLAVLRAAEELGYRPNAHAARLASHRTMTLGVVLTQLDNPVQTEAFRAVEERAEEAGYSLLFKAGILITPAAERAAIADMLDHRVDGIVMLASRLPKAELQDVAGRVPLSVVFREVPGVDSVTVEERRAAELVMDHLIGLGHSQIAHVDGASNPGSRLRRSAYESAMRRAGLERHARVVTGGYTEEGGLQAADELLGSDSAPTAIFAANDMSALGVLAAARRRGLTVPEDLAVAGFDNSALSALAVIDLTSVDQPKAAMGRSAVDLVLSRISTPARPAQHVVLPPELIVRSTTATSGP